MSMIPTSVADAVYRSNLLAFTRKSFAVLNPGAKWEHNWHLEAMCHALERVKLGKCRRLLLTTPPRMMKSHVASIAVPAFTLGHDPTKKIVCVSYSQDLGEKHASDCRRLIESSWYQRLYPEMRLSRSTASEIETEKGGYRLTTSPEGTLTGRGGDIIIIDDPMNAKDAYSRIARDTLKKWFTNSLLSRLNSPSTGAIIVIMQRLHEEDLIGHLMESGQWEILNLPAIAPHDMEVPLSDDRKHIWKKEELLHEARLPKSVLETLKRDMGTDVFNAQYRQAPVPETGNMLERGWLQYYDGDLVPEAGDEIVQSWDTALKAGPTNDYSVCLTFVIRNRNKYFLIDVFRKRLEFYDLCKVVAPHAAKFRADTVLIEEHAGGIPFVQEAIRRGVQGVVAIKHRDDKITRMRSAMPKIEGGSLYLPISAPWLEAFILEYVAIPSGAHDDQMDALSAFLNWCTKREGGSYFEADFGYGDNIGAPSPEELLWRLGR